MTGSGRGVSGASREQEIRRMKHSPGSGVLAVVVEPDGPTRILRVTDENKKVCVSLPAFEHIIFLMTQKALSFTHTRRIYSEFRLNSCIIHS